MDLHIDGQALDLEQVVRIARDREPVGLAPEARARMAASFAWVQQAASGALVDDAGQALAVYGVNTGYGSLARVRIEPSQASELSWNLIRSHAAGVGDPLPVDVVRAMMLLRANALAKGASGCQPEVVDTLLAMLNAEVHPVVPSQGSCGSSGDLAPLAHLALVVFRPPAGEPGPGESGRAWFAGEELDGAEAMARAGIPRPVPLAKDGLAMCNGAQLCTALLALAVSDASELVLAAEIAAAMTWEALRGVTRALDPAVHALRPYRGARACAANVLRLVAGSELVDSLPDKVQDAYSVRCTPQILGATRDGLRFVTEQCLVELNAATDNPLILLDHPDANKAFSAGMFHGEPVGMASDHLKLAVTELAALAERRLYRLTMGSLSARLPPLLVRQDRPTLGLMVPQATAAALVSACRALCYPSSADSIPTCEDQEDHVAMATTAARQAREVVEHARHVVAIELLSAAHGLWCRLEATPGVRLGTGTAAALEVVERALGGRGTECPADDIEAVARALQSGQLLHAVQRVCGPLEGVGP